MENFHLGKLSLKTIAIRVRDRDGMIHFYRDIIGLHLLREENELAILGYKDPASDFGWRKVREQMSIAERSKKCNGSH